MASAARKPTTTDDPPETAPALAVAPKTRQRHDPKAKAQAALDRADVRLSTLSAEADKHAAALDAIRRNRRVAQQHRDYLAMHPLLVTQDAYPESATDAGDLSTP